MYTCLCTIYKQINMYVCMYVCIGIYIYIYIHIHTLFYYAKYVPTNICSYCLSHTY